MDQGTGPGVPSIRREFATQLSPGSRGRRAAYSNAARTVQARRNRLFATCSYCATELCAHHRRRVLSSKKKTSSWQKAGAACCAEYLVRLADAFCRPSTRRRVAAILGGARKNDENNLSRAAGFALPREINSQAFVFSSLIPSSFRLRNVCVWLSLGVCAECVECAEPV